MAAKKKGKKRGAAKKASAAKAGKKRTSKKASKKATTKKKVSKKKTSKKATTKKKAAKKTSNKTTAKKSASKKPTATKQPPDVAAPKAAEASSEPASDKPITSEPTPSETSAVSEGDAMPDFELPDQDGSLVSSSQLAGQSYVLYFYPKDDTSGCTKEACGFRDDMSEFESAGVRVIGVSPDKPETHVKFRTKYDLNFTLLADTDKQLSQKLGVWQLKKNYGREYMGIVRSTFLVGKDGKIQKVWRQVRVAGHVPEVLAASKGL